MIDVVKITQTKAFARQDGAILGAVWIASFASTMWSVTPGYALLSLLANILAEGIQRQCIGWIHFIQKRFILLCTNILQCYLTPDHRSISMV